MPRFQHEACQRSRKAEVTIAPVVRQTPRAYFIIVFQQNPNPRTKHIKFVAIVRIVGISRFLGIIEMGLARSEPGTSPEMRGGGVDAHGRRAEPEKTQRTLLAESITSNGFRIEIEQPASPLKHAIYQS